MKGIRAITTERYACEYCGADGSWVTIDGPAWPVENQKRATHDGNWDLNDVSRHILEQHPEEILKRLEALP